MMLIVAIILSLCALFILWTNYIHDSDWMDWAVWTLVGFLAIMAWTYV